MTGETAFVTIVLLVHGTRGRNGILTLKADLSRCGVLITRKANSALYAVRKRAIVSQKESLQVCRLQILNLFILDGVQSL